MGPRIKITAAQVGAIHRAMLAAPGKSAFQRLQCLWLRASQDLSTEAIADTAESQGEAQTTGKGVWAGLSALVALPA